DAVKKWVEQDGGYLYTEDWGLVETIQKLWPDKVTTGNGADKPHLVRKRDDKNAVIPHIPCKLTPGSGETSHPLMRGVWQKDRSDAPPKADPNEGGGTREASPAKPLEHMWSVDDESPAIDVKDKQTVHSLLESPDLIKIGEGFSQVVAITFRAGSAPPPKNRTATGPGGSGG